MSKYTFKYKGKTYTIDWDDFKSSPHGVFTKYVREHIDPHYQDEREWVDYKVKLTARKYINVETDVVVSIPKPIDENGIPYSQSKIADELLARIKYDNDYDLNHLNWEESYYGDEEIDDAEVDEFEEIIYEYD